MMRRVPLVALACIPGLAFAVPFWGATETSPPATPPPVRKPGEFVWHEALAPAGPIVVVNAQTAPADVVGGRVHMRQDFARLLYPLLLPGTTLVVTDAPILRQRTGLEMTVLTSDNEGAG